MWKWIQSILSPGKKSSATLKHKYVLVVDDSETDRVFYTRTLQKAGYEVVAVDTARGGLDSVKERRPDLILTDFLMPEMNGREMCRIIKEDPGSSEIPVVFLTGSTKAADVVECFDAGCEYFLEKPIDAKCLVRQVNTVLSDLEQEKQAAAAQD